MLVARDPAAGPPQRARPRRRRRARAARGARRRGRAGADAPGERGRARRSRDAALAAYIKTAQALPLDPVTDAAACRASCRCSTRHAPCRSASMPPPPPIQWFPGLSQTGKLGAGAREVYRHALQHMLLPRLIVRLEGQMRAHFEQPAFLYEATQVYLMLGSAGPLDRDLVKEWMSLDWQSAVAGPRGEGPARQPGAPSRGAARPAAGEGAARRRPDRGRAPHVQPRVAGGARLQHDQRLAAGAGAAAVAAGRCRRRLRRARVHPPLRRAADRGRARLLHHRRLLQGAAAQPAGGDHAGRERELGARQGRADRSRPARRC